jgi:hypothetical protein
MMYDPFENKWYDRLEENFWRFYDNNLEYIWMVVVGLLVLLAVKNC